MQDSNKAISHIYLTFMEESFDGIKTFPIKQYLKTSQQ